jgi:DNA-directed RNA polymerase subunit RPC12/RpoP
MPLSREQLEEMGCAHCNSKASPRFFHGRCHPGAPTVATVEHNTLTVSCSKCGKTIADVWVDAADAIDITTSTICCPHEHHEEEQFAVLYYENEMLIMCPRCDKLAALFRVLTRAEAQHRQTTN